MAYTWDWNKKIGFMELEDTKGRISIWNMYEGNGFCIFISEWEEDEESYYSVMSFWLSEEHAERCLGITKGTNNIYTEHELKIQFNLDGSYDVCFKIAKMLKKANMRFRLHYIPTGEKIEIF